MKIISHHGKLVRFIHDEVQHVASLRQNTPVQTYIIIRILVSHTHSNQPAAAEAAAAPSKPPKRHAAEW